MKREYPASNAKLTDEERKEGKVLEWTLLRSIRPPPWEYI